MELSRCCNKPIVVELRSDPSNFSDDDYDLKIPFRVCSECGAILIQNRYQGGEIKHAASSGNEL
jgi:hypothetical protein